MGAGNSTPQTERIDNPNRGVPIEVTPSVVTRLEAEKQRQECMKCKEGEEKQTDNKPKEQEEYSEQNQKQKNGNPFIDPGRVQQTPHDWTQTQDEAFQKKYNDNEECQFNRTFETVQSILGKPVALVEGVEEEIHGLRKDLIKCYRDHPGQTLRCADIAKTYQDFIFHKQYERILKLNDSHEKSIPKTPPPPYQHSPPYT